MKKLKQIRFTHVLLTVPAISLSLLPLGLVWSMSAVAILCVIAMTMARTKKRKASVTVLAVVKSNHRIYEQANDTQAVEA